MLTIKTETGSIYELDESGKRIRRLSGVRQPTVRIGTDGEWRSYDSVRFNHNGRLTIVWRVDRTVHGDVERATVTSPVKVSIES